MSDVTNGMLSLEVYPLIPDEEIDLPPVTEPISLQYAVDNLAARWEKCVLAEYQLAQVKNQLVEVIDKLAGSPDKKKGTLTLKGSSKEFKITRRVNVSIEKSPDKDAENPYIVLSRQFPQLERMLKVSVEEKGSEIDKFLLSARDSDDELDKALREAIMKMRFEKPGKSGITLVDRKTSSGIADEEFVRSEDL